MQVLPIAHPEHIIADWYSTVFSIFLVAEFAILLFGRLVRQLLLVRRAWNSSVTASAMRVRKHGRFAQKRRTTCRARRRRLQAYRRRFLRQRIRSG